VAPVALPTGASQEALTSASRGVQEASAGPSRCGIRLPAMWHNV